MGGFEVGDGGGGRGGRRALAGGRADPATRRRAGRAAPGGRAAGIGRVGGAGGVDWIGESEGADGFEVCDEEAGELVGPVGVVSTGVEDQGHEVCRVCCASFEELFADHDPLGLSGPWFDEAGLGSELFELAVDGEEGDAGEGGVGCGQVLVEVAALEVDDGEDAFGLPVGDVAGKDAGRAVADGDPGEAGEVGLVGSEGEIVEGLEEEFVGVLLDVEEGVEGGFVVNDADGLPLGEGADGGMGEELSFEADLLCDEQGAEGLLGVGQPEVGDGRLLGPAAAVGGAGYGDGELPGLSGGRVVGGGLRGGR